MFLVTRSTFHEEDTRDDIIHEHITIIDLYKNIEDAKKRINELIKEEIKSYNKLRTNPVIGIDLKRKPGTENNDRMYEKGKYVYSKILGFHYNKTDKTEKELKKEYELGIKTFYCYSTKIYFNVIKMEPK